METIALELLLLWRHVMTKTLYWSLVMENIDMKNMTCFSNTNLLSLDNITGLKLILLQIKFFQLGYMNY